MARSFKVKTRIEAEDRASRTIGKVESRFKRLGTSIRANALKIGAALAAAAVAFRELDRAGRLEGQTNALRRALADQGIALDTHIAKLKEVARGQVSTAQIVQASNKAILLGIPAQEIAKLLDVARASAIATGESVSKAFDDIVTGIGRASPLILDNLGIVVKLGPVYQAFAAGIGKAAEELSAAEQKQALLNEVLRVGVDRVEKFGEAQSGVSAALNRSRASLDDFRNGVGKLVSGALQAYIDLLVRLADVHTENVLAIDKLRGRSDQLGVSQEALAAAAKRAGISIAELRDRMDEAAEETRKLNAEAREQEKILSELPPAVEVNSQHLARLSFELRSSAEAYRILSKEQLRQLRIQKDIARETEGFTEAMERLGVVLDKEVAKAIEENNVALQKAEQLFRLGAISADELARVEKAVAQANVEAAAAISDTTVEVDQLTESTAQLTEGGRQVSEAFTRVRESIASAGRQAVTTAAQFDELARSAGQAAAVQAALEGGATLSQGGTRIRFPQGGGSRLTSDPFTGQIPGGTFSQVSFPVGGGRRMIVLPNGRLEFLT